MKAAVIFSVLSALLLVVMIFIIGGTAKNSDPLPENWDRPGAEVSTETSNTVQELSNSGLLSLLKFLCYRAEKGDIQAAGMIKIYGPELYRRAKQEKLDLQNIEEEALMLRLLGLLNKYGGFTDAPH